MKLHLAAVAILLCVHPIFGEETASSVSDDVNARKLTTDTAKHDDNDKQKRSLYNSGIARDYSSYNNSGGESSSFGSSSSPQQGTRDFGRPSAGGNNFRQGDERDNDFGSSGFVGLGPAPQGEFRSGNSDAGRVESRSERGGGRNQGNQGGGSRGNSGGGGDPFFGSAVGDGHGHGYGYGDFGSPAGNSGFGAGGSGGNFGRPDRGFGGGTRDQVFGFDDGDDFGRRPGRGFGGSGFDRDRGDGFGGRPERGFGGGTRDQVFGDSGFDRNRDDGFGGRPGRGFGGGTRDQVFGGGESFGGGRGQFQDFRTGGSFGGSRSERGQGFPSRGGAGRDQGFVDPSFQFGRGERVFGSAGFVGGSDCGLRGGCGGGHPMPVSYRTGVVGYGYGYASGESGKGKGKGKGKGHKR